MSHEIRTPMNGILGFTNLITQENIDLRSRLKYSEIIKLSTNRLLRLLEDILDISRIESGILSFQKRFFDLNGLIEQIKEEVKVALEKEGKNHIKFITVKEKKDVEFNVYSDPDRLHQIILNLINNSIRFTEEGYIELGYKVVDQIVEVYIKDTGIGISKDKHSLIFQRFRQEDDSVTRPYDGAGLGLTISKHLVEALGGKITLESEKNKGSVFTFSIPHNNSSTENISTNNDEYSNKKELDLTGKLIYIAEDEAISYDYLTEVLKETNATIKLAINGKQLLELIKLKVPDLILLDINMPVMIWGATTSKMHPAVKIDQK